MATWKAPPRAKIFEALSAVVDNRVVMRDGHRAEVRSSDNTKNYVVEWTADVASITSNDNASFYQGYLGYPMIAVLMKLGKLRYDAAVAEHLAGVPWKQLNTKNKNKYEVVIENLLADLSTKGVDRSHIEAEIDAIMKQLNSMELKRLPKRVQPPK